MKSSNEGVEYLNEVNKSLAEQWSVLLKEEPKLRIRDAAERLYVSELELLQTKMSQGVSKLDITPKQLASKLSSLGKVMSLVRNSACVHEVSGQFASYEEGNSPVGLFLGEQDLRAFFNKWQFIYAVSMNDRRSIQVFDKFGSAIIKIYAIEGSDVDAWQSVIDQYTSEDQMVLSDVTPAEQRELPSYNPEPDIDTLKESWAKLKDVHQFNGILRSLNIPRIQALSLAGPDYAVQLDSDAVEYVLAAASDNDIPTIEFVQNYGVVQIHTAVNQRLVRMGQWYNVLDPNFNLHLNTSLISQTWAVKRPADTGVVSSIEAFDQSGQLVIQIFGKRVEGQAERVDWRSLVDECIQTRALQSALECTE